MTILHHLSNDSLQSYAAGSLSEGWSIAVASHLALCPSCRKRLQRFEGMGGHFLNELPAAGSVDQAWEMIQAELQMPADRNASRPVASSANRPIFPEPLRSYIGGDLGSVKWRSLGRGAYQCLIQTGDPSTSVRLLKIPAGKPVPEHGHGGKELTLVLSGSFVDGSELFARGDIEEAGADLVHQPIATGEADCICLAVTDAPLRFRSWIVRLVQPILGI